MNVVTKVLDLIAKSGGKPVAKVYLEPVGNGPNRAEQAVNPLLLMGLYGD